MLTHVGGDHGPGAGMRWDGGHPRSLITQNTESRR
jgi:hypothetical protein